MPPMKIKHLQSNLQDVEVFTDPKILLEQYPTTPHIAAQFLSIIETRYGDLSGRAVADLGCGCGVLSIGAVMMECGTCLSIDIDSDALDVCRTNLDDYEITNVDLVQADVATLDLARSERLCGCVETVVMNPPFGTKKNEGIDIKFVQAGLHMASNAVYSLHKTSTRKFIQKKAQEWNVDMEVIAEVRFDIPAMYKCHKERSKDIKVDCIRFAHRKTADTN